jgi:hypothetical protein
MKNMENTVDSENAIVCNDEIKDYLLESSKWGRFLAILGYVGMGLLILVGLLVMFGFLFAQANLSALPMFLMGLFYIFAAIVYYFPTTYLYRFSVRIKQGVELNDESVVTDGFSNLKKLLKFVAIMSIVVLSLYILILLILIPVAMWSPSHFYGR